MELKVVIEGDARRSLLQRPAGQSGWTPCKELGLVSNALEADFYRRTAAYLSHLMQHGIRVYYRDSPR